MSEKKSVKKIILKRVLPAILFLLLLFLAAVFVVNKIKLSQELKILDDAGYYNPVSVGDYSMNVQITGNPDGKHRLVALAGGGVCNFGLHLTPITDQFMDENQIVVVDRPGYGLSDDTKEPQTAEKVVEEYRTALKNAGVKEPYILMPHSIGGAYATYWVSQYPEEIEGVVFFDGTQLGPDSEIEGIPSKFVLDMEIISCKMGLYRLVASNYIFPLPGERTEEEQRISYMLSVRTGANHAMAYEELYVNEAAKFAYENIKTNDVPKVYICASWGSETKEDIINRIEWENEQLRALGKKEMQVPDNLIQIELDQTKEKRETVLKPYCEKMGNCKLVLLGGDHFIFDQRPDDCADVIREFLNSGLAA